jgi:hypothetical protein
LDLVDDDEPPPVLQGQHGLGESREIVRVLQIKEGGGAFLPCDHHPRQSGLSHLACANDSHHRVTSEEGLHLGQVTLSLDHDRWVYLEISV